MMQDLWWIAGVFVFVIGAIVMVIWQSIANSKKSHDKHHTHHSELMCDHCKTRTYYSGYSMTEVMRRWPMRILGEKTPRGEG